MMKTEKYNNQEEINLGDLLKTMLINWRVILSGVMTLVVAGLIYSALTGLINPITYKYGARTSILFTHEEEAVVNEKQDAVVIAILKSDQVINSTLKKLKVISETEEIKKDISVRIFSKNVYDIVAYHSDPSTAKDMVNEIRRQGMDILTETIPYKNVTVEEAVLLEKPIPLGNSPEYIKNGVLAGLIGFILSVLYIFMVKFFNKKITSEMDVEKFTGKKILVSIPRTTRKKRKFYEVI